MPRFSRKNTAGEGDLVINPDNAQSMSIVPLAEGLKSAWPVKNLSYLWCPVSAIVFARGDTDTVAVVQW